MDGAERHRHGREAEKGIDRRTGTVVDQLTISYISNNVSLIV